MKPIESSILQTLDVALFSIAEDRPFTLNCAGTPAPKWLDEYFANAWNAEENCVVVEEFSAIGAFLQHCSQNYQTGDFGGQESIIFEEDFGGKGQFAGQITAFDSDGLFFLVRPSNGLDVITRTELQAIRQTALDGSNFGSAKSFRPDSRIGNAASAAPQRDVESFLVSAINSSEDALLVLNESGELVACNHIAQELFPKLSAEQLSSQDLLETLRQQTVSRSESAALIERVEKGLNQRIESTWEFAEPFQHSRRVLVSPVKDDTQRGIGTVWSFIKEKQGVEFHESLSESERLEAIGRLAGGVAHDFNNLLAIVLGNLTLLQHHPEYDIDEDLSTPVKMANKAAEKATHLVKQLLGYSRKTRLDTKATTVEKLLDNTLELFESTKTPALEVSADLEKDTWNINVDCDQLQQVLLNIFDNASFATEGQGTITISTRNFVLNDRDLAEAMDCDPGHYVILTIADDGCGMDKETREKVFEPFFTTKGPSKGTGLGLANALGIARQHGGNITCTSALGEGTAFSIYLPRHRAKSESSKKKSALASRNLKPSAEDSRPIVLVVDDEELLRNLVRTILEKNGFRTLGAENGVEALDMIDEHCDEILAIVLDLAMPEMTGIETFKRLNSMGSEIPVVVASGFLVDAGAFEEETGGKPHTIFSKPYQLTELVKRVKEIQEATERGEKVALIS